MRTIADIIEWDGNQTLKIKCKDDISESLLKQLTRQVVIDLPDERSISPKQRRKVFSLVNSISEYCNGHLKDRQYEETLREMKLLYVINKCDTEAIRTQLQLSYADIVGIDMFSLSDIDMSTARDFIDWLIEMCIKHDIPTNERLLELCEDVGAYLYHCVANRKCCICGKRADIHEVEKVGMGRNRNKIHHLGQAVQPLCRYHHQEEENLGQDAFDDKYHLQYIRLDETLLKKIKWKE